MTPDPRPQANPDHPHAPGGRLEYDPSCWMCREITMQPPPGTKEARP
jgi:hypothetical protein